MNNKTMLQRSLLTTGITLALGLSFGLSQHALADEASDDLEVKAGLSQAMSLDCVGGGVGDGRVLDFGITRINLDDYDGPTEIIVPATSGGSASVQTGTGVTAGTGASGRCELTGSFADDGAELTVEFAQSGSDGFNSTGDVLTLAGDGNAYSSLDGGGLNDLTVDLTSPTSAPTVSSTGASTIYIGGTLNIPETIDASAMGGYSASVQVTVDDGFGDPE